MGRFIHPAGGGRHWHLLYGGAAVCSRYRLYPAHKAAAGAAVPGYDRRSVRKKAGCERAFLLPDTGHLHRHPGGHGQPCRRGGRCFGGRCGRGVLDVGHCAAGCFHLLCGVHSGAEIPRARPAVRRLAGRPSLLPPCAGRAQAGQKAQTLRVCSAVCGVRSDLLVRYQPSHLQLGQLCL